jgi:hypothetical protein
MNVYAVIGGHNYERESFDSLKLFYCKSTAEKYKEELQNSGGFDYVMMEVKMVDFDSFILRSTCGSGTSVT